jgi:hypothetical protein
MRKPRPTFYRIRNWDSFQQYKDRNPKWVKLHYETLHSADWVTADNDTRVLMVVCMLVASRHGGNIPNDMPYLKRVGYLEHEPTLTKLVANGFLSPPKYLRNKDILVRNARLETETETETETEKKEESICAVAPKSRKKPKTSLPLIWPTDIDRQWALRHWREKGRDDLCADVDAQMAEARDHHDAAGSLSANWAATWRTWAQRAIRYNRKGGRNDGKPTAHQNLQRGTIIALERITGE